MTYTISGRLAGANEMVNKAKGFKWYAASKLKAEETKRCALAAIVGSVPRYKSPVRFHFNWVEPNKRRDLDNIRYGAKWIIDGLRECGKLPNDGWSWVVGMTDSWAVDPVNPRVEVTIEEVGV